MNTLRLEYRWLFVAVAFAVLTFWLAAREPADAPDPVIAAVTARLQLEEGFRAHTYDDSVGVLTIGYGTNLAQGITEQQGACLLRLAATADLQTFATLWPPYGAMPFPVQVELADMAYQLGPGRAHGFAKMLEHLAAGEWDAAADEALASKWNDETPARAERAAAVFRAQL